MTPVSLRLSDEVAQRLQRLADRTGRSKTFYTIEAIRDYLEDLEDLYLARQRLTEIQARRSRPVPLEEVMARYGLEGRDGPRRGARPGQARTTASTAGRRNGRDQSVSVLTCAVAARAWPSTL